MLRQKLNFGTKAKIFALGVVICGYVYADERETIDTYIGTELFVETGFAGESITIEMENGEYFICRKVFGSGTPTIAREVHPATKESDWQLRFELDERNSFVLGIIASGELELLLNGFMLKTPTIGRTYNNDSCLNNQ